MQGTILIIDGVATNRIMLKVQLTSAYYKVVQADRLEGLTDIVSRSRPDLIVSALSLPDGSALDIRGALGGVEAGRAIPIIAIADQNDRNSRLRALEAGIDDVLNTPLDDTILQARIRGLVRRHGMVEDLQQHGHSSPTLGFAEPVEPFLSQMLPQSRVAHVALVAQNAATSALWRARLKSQVPYNISTYQIGDVQALMARPVPDAVVIELDDTADGKGLRLLADLRARIATRDAVVIAVPNPANPHLAAEALDRGAHDAMHSGFCVEELGLRLGTQLRLKARQDRARDTVRDGLRAAMLDDLTGLYNRRYALPQLAWTARRAMEREQYFAVMLADLDHFKTINDRFGHPAGDAVLVETAQRLQGVLGPSDLLARIGGEEFMVVIANIDPDAVRVTADRLCRAINGQLFTVPGVPAPIQVTASIGVAIGPDFQSLQQEQVETLIQQADRALYRAKHAGRNQVTLARAAAA
ncbi:MAG: diguanylate cyclase [Rhodobacteraceae bacterium]|nr:diguanylate cyclase [Paracoccaceae bacterium]